MFKHSFEDIPLTKLHDAARELCETGWRAVQVLATRTQPGFADLTYAFERDGEYRNLQVRGVAKDDVVPSLQDLYFGLFPFENEMHDLFGINVEGMALDFQGAFYSLSEPEPMTIISPQQKEAREKAAKAAAAKAIHNPAPVEAYAASATGEPAPAPAPAPASVITDEEIEAKVAAVPEEKREQIRKALLAKQAKQRAALAKEGE